MSDREHFIATLQACYFGDRNAFDEIVRIYDKKENITKEDIKPTYEELEKRMYNCAKYLHSIESHDFNADIPISILSGNVNAIKKYLDRQIEIYKDNELEFTDEINCLKEILK